MNILRKCARFIDNINEKVGFAASWLTTILVVVVCYDVFTRYLLKKSSVAAQELEWHIFAVIFLVGAAYTLKHDKHVRVDVLYARFSPKRKAIINMIGCVIFLMPFIIMIIWTSRNFVANSYMFGETSPDPGGLPARYVLKGFIPLGFFFLFMQALSLLFKSIITVFGGEK